MNTPDIPTQDIAQMVEFILKNVFFFIFYFIGEVKKHKSGKTIGSKFTPPHACIFMNEVETVFLKSQGLQLLLRR